MIDPQPLTEDTTGQNTPAEALINTDRVNAEKFAEAPAVQEQIGGSVSQEATPAPSNPLEENNKTIDGFMQDMPQEDEGDSHYASRLAARTVDLKQIQNVKDIAEKLNTTPEAAAGMLMETPAEELKANPALKNLAVDFPSVSEWARNPENYKVLQMDPKWAKKTEAHQDLLSNPIDWAGNFSEDVANVFHRNVNSLAVMRMHLALANGTVSKEKALQELKANQDELEAHPILHYQTVMKQFQEDSQALTKAYDAAYTAIRTGKSVSTAEKDSWVSHDSDFEKLGKPAGAFIDYLWDRLKNPDAFLLQSAEGLSTMGPAAVGGVVGKAAGALFGPETAWLGGKGGAALGGYVGGYLGFYGMNMMEQQEKFRDPNTGKIDFDKMYADPKAIQKMQSTATKYALTHGVFGAVSAVMAGGISKLGPNVAEGAAETAAKGTLAKVGSKIGDVAVETAGQSALTVGGETAARLATGETLPESFAKGTEMAVMSLPIDAAKAPIHWGVNEYFRQRNIKRAIRLYNDKVAAFEAVKNYSTDQETRAANAESPIPKEHPQQAEDLVREHGKPGEPEAEPVDEHTPVEDVGEESPKASEPSRPNFKQFTLRDFEAKAEEMNMSGLELASALGSKGVDAYITAKQGNHSFFQVDEADYHRHSKDVPELDDIAHTNGSEMNYKQAKEKIKEVIQGETELYNHMVYHGTAYDFDKFSTEKIGTGEGAQAFGHGLYFTESKDIADYYRKKIAAEARSKIPSDVQRIIREAQYFGFDRMGDALSAFRQDPHWEVNWDAEHLPEKDLQTLRDYVSGKTRVKKEGQLYQAEIPNPEDMMDWNAPIKDQTDKVKEVAKEFGIHDRYEIREKDGRFYVYDPDGKHIGKIATEKDIAERMIREDHEMETGDLLYSLLKDREGGPEAASKYLHDKGIPGIKYQAEGGKSEHRNFVVFHDENVQIKDKFHAMDKDPNATGEGEGNVHYPDPSEEPQMGEPVLRAIQLLQAGRSPEEQQVWKDIKNRLVRSLPNMSPENVDGIAEIQFQHTRFRAENLGRPIADVSNELRVGYQHTIKAKPGWVVRGQFERGATNQMGEPRNAVIFSKDTSPNTVIHEFGHAWLHHLATDHSFISGLSERTPRQQEYFEAMETAAKILGIDNIGDLYNRTKDEVTHLHEVFAKTAEKYFHEGDVPENRVTKAFALMKKWMASVAHMVASSYNGKDGSILHQELEPTPEIARMFQTIVGGSNKVEESMRMFPDPVFDPKIMGPNEAKYREAIANARSEAIAQMYAKFYNMSYNEREAAITQAQNELYRQAHEQVEDLPSIKLMRSIHDLGDRAMLTHQSVLDVLAGGDPEEMKKIKESTAKKIIAGDKKAGVDVREIMKAMGINDPEVMKGMLREMGDRDHMVEDLHNRLIDEHFPILKTDEEIHQAAVEAVQNKGRAKIIEMELSKLMELSPKLMQKMSGTIALPPGKMAMKAMDAIKAAAGSMVSDALYQKLSPGDFLRAADKSGKEASDYLAKGDYENAFQAKEDEAKNHKAFLQALGERQRIAKVEKMLARVKGLKGKDYGYRYDADIFEHAQDIVSALENNQRIPRMETDGYKNQGILDDTRIGTINNLIDAVNILHGGKKTAEMTVLNFNAVGEAVRLITKAASEAKFIELDDRKMHIEDMANATARDIGEKKSYDPTGRSFKSNLVTKILTPRDIFSSLMSEEGWAKSTLAKIPSAISTAEAIFATHRNADEGELSDSTKKMVNSPEISGKFDRPIAAPEIDHTFKNTGELLQALLYWGSESGKEKLIMGGVIKEDGKRSGPLGHINMDTGLHESPKLDAMFARMFKDKTLTKAHTDLAQTVWGLYAKHYEAAKAAIRDVYGYNIGEVKGRKIVTPWGELDGGYVPLARDAAFQDMTQTRLADFVTDTPGTFVKDLFPVANTSFGKERTKAYYPLSLDMNQLKRQLNAVHKVAYMMPTMYQAGKIFDHPTFRTSIEARRPGAMQDVIVPWFKDVMGQTYSTDKGDTMAKAIDGVRKNSRIVQMALNTATWAKHVTGLATATMKVDPRYILGAAVEVGLRPGKAQAEIAAVDPRMKVRFQENVKSNLRAFDDFSLNFTKMDTMNNAVEKLTYAPLQFFQGLVDTFVYTAAKEQARRKFGMTNDKDILNYAANTVEQTQLTTNVSSRPDLMRGNALKRLVTDYASIPIMFHNRALENRIRNMDKGMLTRLGGEMYSFLVLAAVPTLIGGMAGHPMQTFRVLTSNPQNEKDDDYFKDRAIDVGADMLNIGVPVVGQQVASILENGSLHTPALTAGKSIFKTGKYMYKNGMSIANPSDNEAPEFTAKDFKAMLDSITVTTGIPATFLRKTFSMMSDIFPEPEDK